MKRIGIYSPHALVENRLNYTLQFINRHPLVFGHFVFELNPVSEVEIRISYGISEKYDYSIPKQSMFFNANKTANSSYVLNEYSNDNDSIYAIEKHKKNKKTFLENAHFAFDIFETIFFHISRYEEVFCTQNDKNIEGWLTEEKQILVKQGLETKPVVDELIVSFLSVLGVPIIERTRYVMTHDIDLMLKYDSVFNVIRNMAAGVWHKKGWIYFKNQWNAIVNKNDPYDVYTWLLRDETVFDERIIYFLCGGTTSYDRHSNLNTSFFTNLIKLIKKKKYKIGLHPSFKTSVNEELFQEEKEFLEEIVGSKIVESRQHFLRFDFEKTIAIIDNNGIKRDGSLGYQNRIGFRCGTGFPYHIWDFSREKASRFVTLPLVIMDVTLLRNSTFESAIKTLKAQNMNTQITFNFHNSTFDDTMAIGKRWRAFYFKIIDSLDSKNI